MSMWSNIVHSKRGRYLQQSPWSECTPTYKNGAIMCGSVVRPELSFHQCQVFRGDMCLVLFLFTPCVSSSSRVIDSREIGCRSYADDSQLCDALRSIPQSNFDRVSNCTTVLQYWFWINHLFLNSSKSDAASSLRSQVCES